MQVFLIVISIIPYYDNIILAVMIQTIMINTSSQIIIDTISHSSGVYQFYDAEKRLLYIGKAIDLKKRVSQYFMRPHDEPANSAGGRISQMVQKIASIKTIETDTNIEALILEANLINKHKPSYNVLLKDDKTFGGIFITDEKYPRVFPARITDQLPKGEWFGPYVSGNELKIALKVLRRIFKWCESPDGSNLKFKIKNLKLVKPKTCFYYHIGLCSGVCIGEVSKQEYNRQIKHVKMFLRGEKNKLIRTIEKEMKLASKEKKFEQAQKFKLELDGLMHIQESAFVVTGESPITRSKLDLKIECYDIANIGNSSIVGAMVASISDSLKPSLYRKFKIKTITSQNDVGALAEMVDRRLNHTEWIFPDCIIVDGGIGQVNAIRDILHIRDVFIPVVGIIKGSKRNKSMLVGDVSYITANKITLKTISIVRDEAHRFAQKYFHTLRARTIRQTMHR